MDLSEQQNITIREWVASGASLSDVQRNLKTEFGLAMTYIDVRLLVLDLGAAVKDKPEPKPITTALPPQPSHEETGPGVDTDEEMSTDNEEMPRDDVMPEEQEGMGGAVTLTMDSLVVPGAMVSGTVTFSDGIKARWLIDQQGRFGIDPETQGYRPSPTDMQGFQMQLRIELQRKGYM